MKPTRLLLLLCAAAPLAGCNTDMNERPWIGQHENDAKGGLVLVELLRAEERAEVPTLDDGPSLVSLDRRNWAPMVVVSPVDGVAAHRSYANEGFIARATARQRGDHPTALSALDLSGTTRTEQWAESWLNPGIAFLDFALLVPRMVKHQPWDEAYTFPSQYWRAPTTVLRRLPAGTETPAVDPGPTLDVAPTDAPEPVSRPEAPDQQ
jgi:hypothetical protein